MGNVTGHTGMKVNSRSFARQIQAFAKEYNLAAGAEMKNQMRLWCVDNVRNFPPSLNMLKSPTENTIKKVKAGLRLKGSDHALGKRAVGHGISQGAVPLTPMEIKRVVPMHGRYEGKSLVRKEDGATWVTDTGNVKKSASVGDVSRRHVGMRNSRGRVKTVSERRFNSMKDISKLHVRKSVYNKYVKLRQKEVGKLKGGWLAGVKKFGGVPRPAKWINQHADQGVAGGTINDNGVGKLWATNRTHYASHYRWVSNYNLRERPRLAIKAMEQTIKAIVKAENKGNFAKAAGIRSKRGII